MAQPIKVDVDFLQHFGVKGMRWGHRKNRTGSARKPGKKNPNTARNIKLGATFAATLLLTAGMYKMGDIQGSSRTQKEADTAIRRLIDSTRSSRGF